MTFLRNEGNMPVVIIRPGDVGMAHKKNEYVNSNLFIKHIEFIETLPLNGCLENNSA